MKKLFKLLIFLFYNYYDKGSTKIIAYQSALVAASLLVLINFLSILIISNIDINEVFPVIKNKGRIIYYISSIVLWIPFYLLFNYLFKENAIKKMEVGKNKIKVASTVLVLYIIVSIILLFLVVKSS